MNFDDTARFFGPSNKLWPELFKGIRERPSKRSRPQWKYPPQAWWPGLPGKGGSYCPQTLSRISARTCSRCKKAVVSGNKRFCSQCARISKLAKNRESYGRGRESGKVKFSPIRAEALTTPKNQVRYDDPKTSFAAFICRPQKGGVVS
jgi:hypothetical protein